MSVATRTAASTVYCCSRTHTSKARPDGTYRGCGQPKSTRSKNHTMQKPMAYLLKDKFVGFTLRVVLYSAVCQKRGARTSELSVCDAT